MTYDCVVIGAGVSGLTTALLLARHGRRVALVELAPRIAPLLQGFSRGGRHFETGFHYAGGLDETGILSTFLRYLGMADAIEAVPYAAAGFDQLRYGGGEGDFRFPVGYAALEETLTMTFPAERAGIRGYLAELQQACGRLPYLNLEADFDALGPFGAMQGPSLAEVLGRFIAAPRLRQILELHTLLHGVPAAAVPFALHASVAGLYYRSVHGIRGGGRALAAAFARQLERAGIDLFTRCRVTALRWSATGELSGVTTAQGELLECRSCVASIHPARFLELVGAAPLRPAYRKRLQALEETVSAYLGFFASDRPLPLLAGRNLYLAGAGGCEAPLEERLLYLAGDASPDATTPATLVAIVPAAASETAAWAGSRRGERPASYSSFKASIMERLQTRIERQCPELSGSLKLVAGSTPLSLRDYLGHPGGGLYGVGHRIGQYNPQAATRLPGVFLTGQATAAPGLLGGMLAGFLTGGEMLGHQRLRQEVKQCMH